MFFNQLRSRLIPSVRTDRPDWFSCKENLNYDPARSELFRLRSEMLECPFPFDKIVVSNTALL